MGNSQPPSQVEFLERKLDPNYGEIVVYLNKDTNLVFTQIKQVLSSDVNINALEQSITQRYELNRIRKQLDHQALIKIISYDKGEMDDLCSSFKVLSIAVEYFPENLQNDIRNRKMHRTSYNEPELLYLINSVVDVCIYMKDKKQQIQDIYPQKILIDEKRKIKVFDQFLESQQVNNYFKVLFGMRDLEYIAPEQLVLLKGEIRTDSTNQELVNVFCLGIMIVSLISGQRCVEFYNSESLEFKKDYVQSLLDKYCLRYTFSAFFKQLIQQMIKIHNQDRPGYHDIQDQLRPYSHNIADFLNPPGMQQMNLESQIHSVSRPQSYVPIPFDYSEIDKMIKLARQKAQGALDEGGLDLRLNNFKGSTFTIMEE